MKLSIIILCWNDRRVIADCLRSIFENTHSTEFEVIVSDNGSTDGSIEFIRDSFPKVSVIENGRNLRFAKANNVGIRASIGEYVLILNPDTIIHDGTLDKMIAFADRHPEAGAFGCKVLNSDGSYQVSGRPFTTLRTQLITALYLRPIGYLSERFQSDMYIDWKGETERTVGYLSGCFILVRGDLLRRIDGFDEQFFYYYEDVDLCRRIWEAGYPIIYTPTATITHLGGESTKKRFPALTFALDGQVTLYRYCYKYYGRTGVRRCRRIALASASLRRLGYSLLQSLRPTEIRKARVQYFRGLFEWHSRVDPVRLVENGEEPNLNINAAERVSER
jgi:GT2 family glycosyltransferase